MLPRTSRLPRAIRLKSPHRVTSNDFIFFYSKNDLSISRFRMIISKKLSKKAVDRNHMRRIFYTFLRENLTNIPFGYDIVCVPKHPYSQLEKDQENNVLLVLKGIA
ncbi:MAG: ribonuclease P protein component [Candidatus Levybacteria bacterium]|nr:ribonuclease P protein component [Candidatus Levybacteria bacterium]